MTTTWPVAGRITGDQTITLGAVDCALLTADLLLAAISLREAGQQELSDSLYRRRQSILDKEAFEVQPKENPNAWLSMGHLDPGDRVRIVNYGKGGARLEDVGKTGTVREKMLTRVRVELDDHTVVTVYPANVRFTRAGR